MELMGKDTRKRNCNVCGDRSYVDCVDGSRDGTVVFWRCVNCQGKGFFPIYRLSNLSRRNGSEAGEVDPPEVGTISFVEKLLELAGRIVEYPLTLITADTFHSKLQADFLKKDDITEPFVVDGDFLSLPDGTPLWFMRRHTLVEKYFDVMEVIHCRTDTTEVMDCRFFKAVFDNEDLSEQGFQERYVGVLRDFFGICKDPRAGPLRYVDEINYGVGLAKQTEVVVLLMQSGAFWEDKTTDGTEAFISVTSGGICVYKAEVNGIQDWDNLSRRRVTLEVDKTLFGLESGRFFLVAEESAVVMIGRYRSVWKAKENFDKCSLDKVPDGELCSWLGRFCCTTQITTSTEESVLVGRIEWYQEFYFPAFVQIVSRLSSMEQEVREDLAQKVKEINTDFWQFIDVVSTEFPEMSTKFENFKVYLEQLPQEVRKFLTPLELDEQLMNMEVDSVNSNTEDEVMDSSPLMEHTGESWERDEMEPKEWTADVTTSDEIERLHADNLLDKFVEKGLVAVWPEDNEWSKFLVERRNVIKDVLKADENVWMDEQLNYLHISRLFDRSNLVLGDLSGKFGYPLADSCGCFKKLSSEDQQDGSTRMCSTSDDCINRQLSVVCGTDCGLITWNGNKVRKCRNCIPCHPEDAYKVEVRWMGNKGWGVVAKEKVPARSIIVEYVGEILTVDEFEKRDEMRDSSGMYFANYTKSRYVDASAAGNFSRFINHSCAGWENSEMAYVNVPRKIEKKEVDEAHIVIVSTKEINIDDEISYNYSKSFSNTFGSRCFCDKHK